MEGNEISQKPQQMTIVKKGLFYYLFSLIGLLIRFFYKLIEFAVHHTHDFFKDIVSYMDKSRKEKKYNYHYDKDNEVL